MDLTLLSSITETIFTFTCKDALEIVCLFPWNSFVKIIRNVKILLNIEYLKRLRKKLNQKVCYLTETMKRKCIWKFCIVGNEFSILFKLRIYSIKIFA